MVPLSYATSRPSSAMGASLSYATSRPSSAMVPLSYATSRPSSAMVPLSYATRSTVVGDGVVVVRHESTVVGDGAAVVRDELDRRRRWCRCRALLPRPGEGLPMLVFREKLAQHVTVSRCPRRPSGTPRCTRQHDSALRFQAVAAGVGLGTWWAANIAHGADGRPRRAVGVGRVSARCARVVRRGASVQLLERCPPTIQLDQQYVPAPHAGSHAISGGTEQLSTWHVPASEAKPASSGALAESSDASAWTGPSCVPLDAVPPHAATSHAPATMPATPTRERAFDGMLPSLRIRPMGARRLIQRRPRPGAQR